LEELGKILEISPLSELKAFLLSSPPPQILILEISEFHKNVFCRERERGEKERERERDWRIFKCRNNPSERPVDTFKGPRAVY
jgi:hypothetical protein